MAGYNNIEQGSQGSQGAIYGQFKGSRAAYVQRQELAGHKRALRRVVSTLSCTIT
jgi:hypothetical protein